MQVLNRNVKMPNGKVYSYHYVKTITHESLIRVDAEQALIAEHYTNISVVSYESPSNLIDPSYTSFQRTIAVEYNSSLTFDDAYEAMSSHPYYDEYIDEAQAALDEVLPLLTDEQAEQVPQLFQEWKAGASYTVGYRVRYDGLLYKCLQAHTSQEGWEPPNATSLWARIGEGDIPEWVQPTSANPYMLGDKVRHVEKIWQSLIDNNVWEPGSIGTESLWSEIS